MFRSFKSTLILVVISCSSFFANGAPDLESRVNKLESNQASQIQALTDEIAKLKQELSIPELNQTSFSGMGVAASKVYYSKSPLSIGGYGEIVYTDNKKGTDSFDAYRFVPYIGYRFTDKIIFNSEIEFEHGGAFAEDQKGEAIIEFAYIDFLISEAFNLRVGQMLIPVGLINLHHEPTFFPMVQRPDVEKNIIPSTWHENGLMTFGKMGMLSAYLGVVNGGDSNNVSGKNWIRGARQKGAEAKSEDFGTFLRLDVTPLEGLSLGVSHYTSKNSQEDESLGDSKVSLSEVHSTYSAAGFDFKALFTQGSLTDTDLIQSVTGELLGSKVQGAYAILSYDIAKWVPFLNGKSLPLFVSHETYNLHDEVETGNTADPILEKTISTVGINFKPHSNVVIKADYQFRSNESDDESKKEYDKFELGLGWIF